MRTTITVTLLAGSLLVAAPAGVAAAQPLRSSTAPSFLAPCLPTFMKGACVVRWPGPHEGWHRPGKQPAHRTLPVVGRA